MGNNRAWRGSARLDEWVTAVARQAGILLLLLYVIPINYLFFRLPRDTGQELDCKEKRNG